MGESGKGIGATPRRYAIGYTQGTFDLFHAGHLRLIERAKAQCERLVAGVNSDLLVEQYKGRRTVVPQDERMAIIEALAAVDEVRLEDTLDKVSILSEIPFEAVFIGDDWRGHERWTRTERDLAVLGVQVVFLPYTEGLSSTALRERLGRRVPE
jgi:glycerol-3-phosphate cytidylyltransferase